MPAGFHFPLNPRATGPITGKSDAGSVGGPPGGSGERGDAGGWHAVQGSALGDEGGGRTWLQADEAALSSVPLIQDRRGIASLLRGGQPVFRVIPRLLLYRAAGVRFHG
jgi:hypothetical protein